MYEASFSLLVLLFSFFFLYDFFHIELPERTNAMVLLLGPGHIMSANNVAWIPGQAQPLFGSHLCERIKKKKRNIISTSLNWKHSRKYNFHFSLLPPSTTAKPVFPLANVQIMDKLLCVSRPYSQMPTHFIMHYLIVWPSAFAKKPSSIDMRVRHHNSLHLFTVQCRPQGSAVKQIDGNNEYCTVSLADQNASIWLAIVHRLIACELHFASWAYATCTIVRVTTATTDACMWYSEALCSFVCVYYAKTTKLRRIN